MTREEAIRRIKAWNLDVDDMEVLSEVIPELKENEDSEDVRIRKAILGLTYLDGIEPILTKCSVTRSDILSYLEKQKEQKPVRDIVPGDAIESCMLRYLQSAANRNDDIEIIADTKAYKSELIRIIEKEQKPAGATINGEPIPTENQSVDIPLAEWSEEDEERIQSILFSIGYCKDEYPNRKDYSKDIDWLKSLSLNLRKKNEDVEKLCSNEWSEEDERIRKDLIKYLKSDRNYQPCQDVSFYDSSIGWLEKQKECGEANFREGYLHGFEDAQKEQKPVPINSDDKYMLERIMALIEFCDDKEIIWSWLCEKVKVATQKPAEWSEEDETCLTNTLIMLKEYAIHHYSKDDVNKSVNWLENRVKFLRPQSHKETYQAAKHDLAIRFMNYLDENRPEGKMSLSNGECEDIDKAFKENDWTKIMQYAKKYLIQSEQQPVEWSEEDEEMLNSCISSIEESKENRYAYKENDGDTSYDREIAWLKSLHPQPKNEWSEEDKKILLSIIKAFRNGSVSTIGQEQWLKSLPERLNLQPQAKQGQKPLEYLTKKKINSIMSKLTNLSFSKLIPFNSEEYKKIDEITSDVCGLLDYPIEQKPAEWSEDDSIKIAKLREIFFDYAWHIDALDRNQDLTGEYAELDNWLGTLPERFNLQPKNEWS